MDNLIYPITFILELEYLPHCSLFDMQLFAITAGGSGIKNSI
jgi:hypothetical protein